MDGSEIERDVDAERDDDHLQNVTDGCGCVEIWEQLAEQRNE